MIALVDSSAVLALLNANDRWHARAVETLEELVARGAALVTTNFLVAECHALLVAGLGSPIAREWLLSLDWNVVRVSYGDEQRATEIISRFRDESFSYTDATSFAVFERCGLDRAFTFDRHFVQYGIPVVGRPTP